ncbi:MAG: hypothetical protein QXH67_07295 [Candidatus Bathyarchaeia archaeon]
MLLSEMLRRIRSEEETFTDTNYYDMSYPSDWVTKVSKTIQLDEPAIIHFYFELFYSTQPYSGTHAWGNARLLVDNVPVCSTGEQGNSDGGAQVTVPRSGFIYLGSGSHTFSFQLSGYRFHQGYVRLKNVKLRKINFPDVDFLTVNSGYITAPNASETTVINQNLTPTQRRTVAGNLKETPINLIGYMEQQNWRQSILLNPGESPVSGKLNWRLYINDVQVAWSERKGDFDTGNTDYQSYCEGAYGFYKMIKNVGEPVNVKVKVYNAVGSDASVRAILTIFSCPWIIPDVEYQPLSLSFPQGSTLYAILEPLTSDPTKTVKLGKRRAWSFGDPTDYYSMASGTGILSWSYTFEIIEVSNCLLLIGGSGGCISALAVDVR